METTECSNCHAKTVALDDFDGFLVCESCGHMLDDSQLQQHVSFIQGSEDQAAGVFVALDDDGTGAGAGMRGGKRLGSDYASKNRKRLRTNTDQLEAMASTLKLPRHAIEQARVLLKQLHTDHALPKPLEAQTFIAGLLYYVSRSNGLPYNLSELSSAAQVDKYPVALQYRKCLAVLGAQAIAPDMRRIATRTAIEVIQALTDTAESTTGTDSNVPLDHPVVQTALRLLDLVLRLGLHDGRTTRIIAGTVCHLSLRANSLHMDAEKVATIAKCSKGGLEKTSTFLCNKLVEMSAALPFSKHINSGNVVQYLSFIEGLASLTLPGAGTVDCGPSHALPENQLNGRPP